MTLPALPERAELVTPDVAVELERQVAGQIAELDDIDEADEWRRRAEALAAYLAGTDGHGPMLGALRRTEARIGQLLGQAPGSGNSETPRAEFLHYERRREFRTLDIVGGIDFWIRTSDGRLLTIASRNQWHFDDDVNRSSFTIRVDIGGPKTEAHKRVLAIKEGGIVPDWTIQGYITADECLHHAGAIPTRDLFAAFLEAAHHPKFTTRSNHADGHAFWPAYWETLRRYGHGDRLKTLWTSSGV